MSFRVLVVPEDPRYNGAILQPLFERLMEEAGKPRAEIKISHGWRHRGYEAVMSSLPELLKQFKHFDLIFLVVDCDGKRDGRLQRLNVEEAKAAAAGVRLLGVAAVEEVETWLLMGHLDRLKAPWQTVRSDVSVKENHFIPFLRKFGNPTSPDGGRERLMREALQNFAGILQRCDELANLLEQLKRIQ